MISDLNEQLKQKLEYTLLKTDCHRCRFSKMQSDTLEERYAIKFCFKLGKNAIETYGILQTAFCPSCMNRASVFEWHDIFKEDRESVRDDERCGRIKKVRIPKNTKMGIKTVPHPPYRLPVTLLPVTFNSSLGSEAVVMRQLRR